MPSFLHHPSSFLTDSWAPFPHPPFFTRRVQREYYDLESFYGAAEEVALPFEQEASSTTDVETWTKKL